MKIICLEGCSGTGKTTQHKLLNEYYAKHKLRSYAVVEKEYEPFKTAIREWHQKRGPKVPFSEEDVRNFAQRRVETFLNNFSQLESNIDLLLMDRYFYTSAVYQRNCGLDSKEILQINQDYGAPIPDLTFLFDCDPEICFERANERNKKTGGKHLFSTSPKKIAEIREQYLRIVKGRNEVRIINTTKSVYEITSELISTISYLDETKDI